MSIVPDEAPIYAARIGRGDAEEDQKGEAQRAHASASCPSSVISSLAGRPGLGYAGEMSKLVRSRCQRVGAAGFTLVELMTVVAITGVLAAIGVMLVRQHV